MPEIPRPASRNPEQFQPLFVLTTARSYSSVVTTMIGQHPALMGLPELKLFSYPTAGELDASLPDYWLARGVKHRSPGLVRSVAQLEFGDQKPHSVALALAWLRSRPHWSGADVLDVLLGRLHPRTAVEKSPENVESEEALERLASAYPYARYLHLTRNPIPTQRSMRKYLGRIVPGFSMKGQPMSGIAAWAEIHCRILKFAGTLPPDRYLRVKAEEVLNNSHSQLKLVCTWLGVRTDDPAITRMTHPEESPFACEGPAGSGIFGGNDPDFLRDPIPRPAEVHSAMERPLGWVGNSFLWQTAVDVASRLGYA